MPSLSEGPQIFFNHIPMNYKFMFLSFPPLSLSSTLLPSKSHTGSLVLWRESRAERAIPISIGEKAGTEKKKGCPHPNQDQETEEKPALCEYGRRAICKRLIKSYTWSWIFLQPLFHPWKGRSPLINYFICYYPLIFVQTFVEGLKCVEIPMGALQTPLTAGSSSKKLAPSSQKTLTVSIDVISKMWAGEMTCG